VEVVVLVGVVEVVLKCMASSRGPTVTEMGEDANVATVGLGES
jgi:hypothetical protein